MILEACQYLVTPASSLARSLGFVSGSLAVRSRYLRCKEAWKPHLDNTRALILEAARRCAVKGKVAVLGGGLLHDVPLRELAAEFEEVYLVDMFHPLCSYVELRGMRNVRRVNADVTGILHLLADARRSPSAPLPIPRPEAWMDGLAPDLTISLNVLSQLCWAPNKTLGRSHAPAVLEPFLTSVVSSHLQFLAQISGHTALVTDFAWRRTSVRSRSSEEWEVLQGVPLPPPEAEWEWRIAPAPEREPSHDFTARVAGYPDWKKSGGSIVGVSKGLLVGG
jgi:hypothetical protein